ncbi:MAG: UDP-N-acetylmuramate:L-alanyl-gamma-D-glutamyl-meso-diaminopimelate ligase [Gammaproteobacteria bacterium]|nr:UDP-N-acetylmuramate:L-alanyl-gamma-D-glutamyl-meso-diaminopimelate ligase [Gammaproteobacteria bacterium]
MKKIQVLGICGTFMAGVAVLAKQLGAEIEGCDEKVYPPMSTQLHEQGICLKEGYHAEYLEKKPDQLMVGNVIRRGNPVIETALNEKIDFISGPQWLAENILKRKRVIAVSGTHGKTTTSSMVAFILEQAGLNPGFLIGGVPENFAVSARLTESDFFVIEADEYDSAFFDKRPKFMHYQPEILIINNLEFDHADIYENLKSIQTQFHYLVRTVPSKGLIIKPADDQAVDAVLAQGCWTPTETVGLQKGDWQAILQTKEGSYFQVFYRGKFYGEVKWHLIGLHNVKNALAALAVAQHLGISSSVAVSAFAAFRNVKRRLEIKGVEKGVTLYDDFAHHPTAIETTVSGLRARIGKQRLIALLELGSYTMRTGVHQQALLPALSEVDEVYFLRPAQANWDVDAMVNQFTVPHAVYDRVEDMVDQLSPRLKSGDHVLAMSNSAFGQVHEKLLQALRKAVG